MEHILLGIFVFQVGELISLGIYVSQVGERISLGLSVFQVTGNKNIKVAGDSTCYWDIFRTWVGRWREDDSP